MLCYENATGRAFRIDRLTFTRHDIQMAASMFDLILEVTEEHEDLILKLGFATALFDRDRIERWATGFETLLRGLSDDPDRSLGRLDLLTQEDRGLIARFNDTAATYPADATLVSLFAAIVARQWRPCGGGGRWQNPVLQRA